MHVLVCGFGSIGKRHVRNLLHLECHVYVWKRSFNEVEILLLKQLGIQHFIDFNAALSIVDAVIIATPPISHIKLFNAAIAADKHIYLEKPLSHTLESLSELSLPSGRLVVEIGCQLRNHPALISMREKLMLESRVFGYRFEMGHKISYWRENYDFYHSYTSNIDQGGGAMLELIHMIDLSLWFYGPVKKVVSLVTNRGILDLNCDDYTLLMIEHSNGIVGTIQLDMTAPSYHCEIQSIANDYIYKFDLKSQVCLGEGAEGSEVFFKTPDTFSRNDLFVARMKAFLNRITNSSLPAICSLNDGINSLTVAFKAFESSKKNMFIYI